MVKTVLLFLILAAVPLVISAQSQHIRAEVSAFSTLSWKGENQWNFSGLARGELDFRSPPGSPVQGRLQLRTIAPIEQFTTSLDLEMILGNTSSNGITGAAEFAAALQAACIQVPRAYVRFRFPVTDEYSLRVTAGIDRLTWGIGSVLKAGDLLFGADIAGEYTGLSRFDEVRDETAFLISLYLPLGETSYLETVLLPQPDDPPRAGMRSHFAFDTVTVESSYLYRGEEHMHTFSLSLQGNVFDTDIYGGIALDEDFKKDSSLASQLTLTMGGFRSFRIGYDAAMTARIELLYAPGDQDTLLVYGDIGYMPNRTLQLFLRGLCEPLNDNDTTVMAGASWNIFQGFSMQGILSSRVDASGIGSAEISAGFVYRF